MFNGCRSLTSLDLSSFDISNVTDMNAIFEYCSSLVDLKLKGIKLDMDFSTCPKLNATSIKYLLSNIETVTSKTFNITGCVGYDALSSSDLEVTNATSKGWVIVPELIPQEVTLKTGPELNAIWNSNMSKFERATTPPPTGISINDISEKNDGSIVTWYDTVSTTQYWYSNAITIYMNPDSSEMFWRCTVLPSLYLFNFDTSKVTNMSEMFYNCNSLVALSLGISKFDTSNVTNMSKMFYNCSSLASLDLSHFNTSNVTNMSGMFYSCSRLSSSLIISNFNTSKVTNMSEMFRNCVALYSLNISNFNTSKVTNMSGMFYNCKAFYSLNLSSFDTSNVIDMSSMFWECLALTRITYGINFNKNINLKIAYMFMDCPANKPSWWV